MPGPGPGGPPDLRAARRFRVALLLRVAVGVALWAFSGTRPHAVAAFVLPAVVGLVGAPSDAKVRRDRREASMDGATAGFWVLVASGAIAVATLVSVALMYAGVVAVTPQRATAAAILVALVIADYAVLRLGLAIAPDASEA